jgi:leader peptidase (prepilin peptidase)/N-methyltransferase
VRQVLRDLEPLATSPGAYVFAAFLGLLWGSFANVCIYRWPPSEEFPKGRSVVAPGSHCFACKTPIRWYDNTPIIAWLWLRGKCRTCKAPFSSRYLIVEALMGLLFALAWWFTVTIGVYFEPFDQRLIRFAIYAAFCFVMVVVTFIDIDHKLILDKLMYPSIVIFFGLGFLLAGHSWYAALIGAIAGYALPWTIGEVYWLVTGRDGLGMGDAKLLALVGALLGVKGVVASLFGGAVVGAVVGIMVLVRGTGEARRGAAFAVAAVISVCVATFGALTNRVVLGGPGDRRARGLSPVRGARTGSRTGARGRDRARPRSDRWQGARREGHGPGRRGARALRCHVRAPVLALGRARRRRHGDRPGPAREGDGPGGPCTDRCPGRGAA